MFTRSHERNKYEYYRMIVEKDVGLFFKCLWNSKAIGSWFIFWENNQNVMSVIRWLMLIIYLLIILILLVEPLFVLYFVEVEKNNYVMKLTV